MKLKPDFKVIKKVIIWVVVAAVLGGGGYWAYKAFTAQQPDTASANEQIVPVVRGDIEEVIKGSGTIEPMSRYDIITLVRGTILSAPFEEGDLVQKDDLLYEFDNSDAMSNVEKTRNNITKAKMSNQTVIDSLKDLIVYAPCDGRISNFNLRLDDNVNTNAKVADVTNDSVLIATVFFNEAHMSQIREGQSAAVILRDYMTQLPGWVSAKTTNVMSSTEGAVLYGVEITFENTGGITEGMEVNAVIRIGSEDVISPHVGTVKYSEQRSITCQGSGTVSRIHVKDGQFVKAGDIILELSNETLQNTIERNNLDLKDAQITLDAQMKALEDYRIKSPITGTIITKNSKLGDTINNVGSNVILATVADMSKMTFLITIDELDIAKINVGQDVSVTADALTDAAFDGRVTNIAAEGKAQNGVTTYDVEVTIDEPGTLKPGMNVNAEIVISSKKDILKVPIAAVSRSRQGGAAVMVVTQGVPELSEQGGRQWGQQPDGQNVERAARDGLSPDNAQQRRRPEGQAPEGAEQRQRPEGQASEGAEQRQRPEGQAPENEGQNTEGQTGERAAQQQTSESTPAQPSASPGQPADAQRQASSTQSQRQSNQQRTGQQEPVARERREVEVGVNDDEYIEITSGLSEGDFVIISTIMSAGGGASQQMRVGGMGGGMAMPMGGGMGGSTQFRRN